MHPKDKTNYIVSSQDQYATIILQSSIDTMWSSRFTLLLTSFALAPAIAQNTHLMNETRNLKAYTPICQSILLSKTKPHAHDRNICVISPPPLTADIKDCQQTGYGYIPDHISTFIETGAAKTWGWEICARLSDFPMRGQIHIGALQNNITRGTNVGTIALDMKNGNLIVEFAITDTKAYAFSRTQVYIGIVRASSLAPEGYGFYTERTSTLERHRFGSSLSDSNGNPMTYLGDMNTVVYVVAEAKVRFPCSMLVPGTLGNWGCDFIGDDFSYCTNDFSYCNSNIKTLHDGGSLPSKAWPVHFVISSQFAYPKLARGYQIIFLGRTWTDQKNKTKYQIIFATRGILANAKRRHPVSASQDEPIQPLQKSVPYRNSNSEFQKPRALISPYTPSCGAVSSLWKKKFVGPNPDSTKANARQFFFGTR